MSLDIIEKKQVPSLHEGRRYYSCVQQVAYVDLSSLVKSHSEMTAVTFWDYSGSMIRRALQASFCHATSRFSRLIIVLSGE